MYIVQIHRSTVFFLKRLNDKHLAKEQEKFNKIYGHKNFFIALFKQTYNISLRSV